LLPFPPKQPNNQQQRPRKIASEPALRASTSLHVNVFSTVAEDGEATPRKRRTRRGKKKKKGAAAVSTAVGGATLGLNHEYDGCLDDNNTMGHMVCLNLLTTRSRPVET
jgi:hypothetical protein